MEDKLREYRFLKQSSSEQKAVLLGQLDGVRRELLEVLASSAPRIMFAKEIVREVLNFASAGDDTPRSGASPSQPSSRLPSSREKVGRDSRNGASLAESSLFSLMSASPKPSLPSGQPSYGSLHDNDLWEGGNHLSRHNSTKQIAGPNGNDDLAVPVPGATTTASRGGSRTLNSSSTTQQYDSVKDRSRRYGSSCTSTVSHHHITDEDIYGPAPVVGSKHTSSSSPGGAGGADAKSNTTTGGASGSSAAVNNDVNRPGGMLKIREMLSRAEKGLSAVQETKEQRRAPPRILGGESTGHDRAYGTEDWDGISPSGYNTPPPEFDGEIGADGSRPWAPSGVGAGGTGIGHPGYSPAAASTQSFSVRDWTIKAEPNSASQFTPRSTTGGGVSATDGGDASSTLGGSGGSPGGAGLPGLVGKLAGFAFVLGSIAAATMAATGTLPGSHSKDTTTRTREQQSRSGASTRSPGRRASQGGGGNGADVPPWRDGNSKSTPSSSTGAGARRKASSGRASKSTGGTGHQQGPVMHVHQPPSSNSFPTVTPPDVTAAMG